MDFWSTVRILLRRWYIAIPVFGLTLLAAGSVYASVPTRYESTGTLVLVAPPGGATIGPEEPTDRKRTNPLLAFDGSLTITAQILIQSMGSKDVQEELGLPGTTDAYQVGNGLLDGPFVVVVAESSQDQRSQEIATQALERIRRELDQRQIDLGAPPPTFITAAQVVPPTPPEPKTGGKIRAAGVALVLGFAASLGSAYMLESMLLARRKRRADKLARRSAPPPPQRHNGSAPPNPRNPGQSGSPPPGRRPLMPIPPNGPGEPPRTAGPQRFG